jgi:hypothetical protein
MRSIWNPNRFLSSISPAHWGNPQPTKTFKRRLVASVFNSTNKAKRRIRKWTIRPLRSRAA